MSFYKRFTHQYLFNSHQILLKFNSSVSFCYYTFLFFLINILKYSEIVTQINLIISTSDIKLKNNLKRRSFDEEMISRRFSTREKWPPERFLATLKCNSVNTRENEVIFAKIK